ncbi:MAG: stage V sporulation protein AC [Clostridiales bacterium]|nr:stage V sporulation protein AC [Clostridiales bacterium]
MSKKEYNEYVAGLAPKSPCLKNLAWAFCVGGLICTLGQLLLAGFKALGLEKDLAATAASASLIFLSALLTALSVYDDIAKHAGAGTLVPITGFANAVVSPAMEFRTEGLVTGMAAKMFVIAGPVIVYGTVASILYGIVYYLATQL